MSEYDVQGPHILTSKVGPRTVRIKIMTFRVFFRILFIHFPFEIAAVINLQVNEIGINIT